MTLWLFALVEDEVDLRRGIGAPLELVRAAGAFVVAQRSAPLPAETANLVAHDRVIGSLARRTAVLPFRFGTTTASATALRSLLAPRKEAIARAFDRVRDAVQLTLRVRGEAAPPAAPPTGGPGTQWLAKRLAAGQVPEIASVLGATKALVRASRAERHDRERDLATVYQLVARSDLRAWRAAVAATLPSLDVEVAVGGPYAPYAFAELA